MQTQNRMRVREMEIMIGIDGIKVLRIDSCEVEYMPYSYPEFPLRLNCGGGGGFKSHEELFDFFIDSVERLIVRTPGRKFVAYPA